MVHITLAGQPAITNGSVRVDKRHLGGPQASTAFGVLVLGRKRGVTRDELADVLWPDRLPVTWEAALRLVVSRVRAFLAAAGLAQSSALSNSSGTYRLHLPAGTVVDVEEAAAAVADAERAAARHRWSDAEGLAARASATLAPAFLSGCGGPWVMRGRDRLEHLRVRALEIVGRAALVDGRTAAAVAAAAEAIRHEPYRETAHRILIESHIAAGHHAEARSAYDRCRQLLVEHLGVDPSPATQELRRKAVNGARAPAARQAEYLALSDVWGRVQTGTTEIVVVHGEAGAGKSHFLRWFADEATRDGVLVVTHRLNRARPVPADDRIADGYLAWLVARASSMGPVVAIVDDMHGAGPQELRLLQLLARAPRSQPLLLVVAHRDTALAPDHPVLTIGRRDGAAVTRIALSPLGRAGIAELASAIGGATSDGTIDEVHRMSGGNARLAAELLGSGSASTDPALRAAVGRHLAGLSDESLQVLTAAAAVGQQFEIRAVQDELALDEDTVLDALDELIAARLTVPVPQNADTCMFRHPIVRSVLVAGAMS